MPYFITNYAYFDVSTHRIIGLQYSTRVPVKEAVALLYTEV